MKPLAIILLAITGIVSILCIDSMNNHDKQHKIDLPEEINLISTDAKHPDLLVGYKSNDTLHIAYSIMQPKSRDYQLELTAEYCYIYDGNRLVGKCSLDSNLIEQLISIDNH